MINYAINQCLTFFCLCVKIFTQLKRRVYFMNSSNKIIVEKIKSFKLFDLNSYNILVNNFGIDRVKRSI